MTPTEFEHLVRQLFEAIGMQSWVTQASKDDGVDAVAVNEDPFMGGHCIIQVGHRRSLAAATRWVQSGIASVTGTVNAVPARTAASSS